MPGQGTLIVLSTVFTGVIAAATIVYTYFAHKQWRATRAQADIARYVAFANMLQTLSAESEKVKAADPRSGILFDAFIGLIGEFGFGRMIEEIDFKDPEARDYFRRLEGILRGNGIDPAQVPWMRPILRNLDKK